MIAEHTSNLAVVFLINIDLLEFIEKEVDFFFDVGIFWTNADSSFAFESRPIEKPHNNQKKRALEGQVHWMVVLRLDAIEEDSDSYT